MLEFKKEKIKDIEEQIKLFNKMIKPFTKKLSELEDDLKFYKRLSAVGETIRWNEYWDQREEDTYDGKILEVDLENQIYTVQITDFYSSYSKNQFTKQKIGTIIKRRI